MVYFDIGKLIYFAFRKTIISYATCVIEWQTCIKKKQCNMYHVMTMTNSVYNKSCHHVYSFPENKICVTVDIIGQIDILLGRVQGKAELTIPLNGKHTTPYKIMTCTLQFARKYKFTVYLYLVLGVVHVHTIEIDCIEICLAFISRFCYKQAYNCIQ